MGIRDNRRTLWLFLIRMEDMNYGETDEVEKSLQFAVCSLPESNRFGPLDSPADAESHVNMTVDEYETIRLIDLEGFTQEECAKQMNVDNESTL